MKDFTKHMKHDDTEEASVKRPMTGSTFDDEPINKGYFFGSAQYLSEITRIFLEEREHLTPLKNKVSLRKDYSPE